jgi:hypothetical protein
MRRISWLDRGAAIVILLALVLGPAVSLPQTAAAAGAACDRACLYGFLDRYLAGMQAHDPSTVPWAATVRYTENNVALHVGDGLWGTVLGYGDFQVRFADPATGGIGFYGIVREADASSPFALRLKVASGRIIEAEAIVARPSEAGVPFVNTRRTPVPQLEEMLPASERTSRARMTELANGYFSTLQQNDGHLHTEFDPRCNRNEDGYQTTNHPGAPYGFVMALGCADQFRLGFYRFDDRLRDRRFLVIDEERGLIMTAGFIDHSGRVTDYKLTDGREIRANIAHPNSLCLLETFKIRGGRIQQVEAVFTAVPYRMPSPWVGAGFHYE